MSEIEFRDLKGMVEIRKAEELQRAVWGDGDMPDPADLMMVIQTEGGLVGGAFRDDSLLGYVFGFPTRDPDIQHSHRLAVLPSARGLGLGAQLKFYQRRWCLDRGIRTVRWTFDPLRAVNAALNIHRLGATSDTYLVDFYGEMGGINQGIASDRLMTRWDLDSDQVTARAEGRALPPADIIDRVRVPSDIDTLLDNDPEQARQIRLAIRDRLLGAFAAGLRISGFDRAEGEYLLSRT
ncbi:MAG: hypothetical protein RLZZ444_2549 [Pseudomonadota bacterium]|jgi:predicted GNAT superfamily acetyltransferase